MRKNYRITETSIMNGRKKAYIVEVQEFKWSLFGLKSKWVTYLKVDGMDKQPWYYLSYESAINEMILQIRRDVAYNS